MQKISLDVHSYSVIYIWKSCVPQKDTEGSISSFSSNKFPVFFMNTGLSFVLKKRYTYSDFYNFAKSLC